MTNDEILQAAKDVGLLHPDAKAASQIAFDFATIIEKHTIERCAVVVERLISGDGICADDGVWIHDCAAAIRAME